MALGLPKQVNMPKAATNSVRELKQSLSNATRQGGNAQRTHRGSISNSNYISYQGVRAQLNGGGRVVVNNYGPSGKTQNNNNIFEKLMMYQMYAQMGTQLAGGISQTVQTIKGSKSEGSGAVDKAKQAYDGWSAGHIASDYNKALNDKSFTQLNAVEANIDKTVKDFSTDYKKAGTDAKQAADEILNNKDVQAGMTSAGATLDTSKLSLSDVKIDENDLTSFDKASQDIDKDIAKLNKFRTSDITTAKTALTKKSGELTTTINSCKAQIASIDSQLNNPNLDQTKKIELENKKKELESQKKDAEAKQKEVDNANTALDQISTDVQKLAQTLTTKKNELGDIKKIKGEIADKKYNMAKELDKTVENNKKKLEKLDKDIKAMQNKGQDANAKIAEFNTLVKSTNNAVTELKAAGDTKIKNGKGSEYQIKNADYQVPNEIQEADKSQQTATPTAGESKINKNNTNTIDVDVSHILVGKEYINECNINQSVQINSGYGDVTYRRIDTNNFSYLINGEYKTITAEALKLI